MLLSLAALDGLNLSPPKAQAIASNTDVLPWPLRPPMTVRPFWANSICTAFTLFTFSMAKLLILTVM